MKYSVSKIRGDFGGECLIGQLKFCSQLLKDFQPLKTCVFSSMTHQRHRSDEDQMSKTTLKTVRFIGTSSLVILLYLVSFFFLYLEIQIQFSGSETCCKGYKCLSF
jgi:hypothetical protein